MKNFSLKSRVFLPHALVLFALLTVVYLFFFLKIRELERKYQENTLKNFLVLLKSRNGDDSDISLPDSPIAWKFIAKEDYIGKQKKPSQEKIFFVQTPEYVILYHNFKPSQQMTKYIKLTYKKQHNSQKTLYQLFLLTIGVGAISLLLFFIIMTLFSRSLREAIREISEITRSIDLDDYDKKVVKIPQNTFGNLGLEFSHLIKRVRSHLKRRHQIEKIRREFTSNVSHELKTPLTSIKGYTETLIAGAIHDNKNNMRFLKIINENIDRLIQLVKDLLELSQIESSERFVKLKSINWDSIVRECHSRWEVEMKKKEIDFTYHSTKDSYKVLGNARAMSHILDNLVQNAYYYNYRKGSVSISFDANEKYVFLKVKDTGIGISGNDQKRIFERFFRVDSSRTNHEGHSGIGLAIVKHLVIQLQGSISLKSELGKGSEFTVALKKA